MFGHCIHVLFQVVLCPLCVVTQLENVTSGVASPTQELGRHDGATDRPRVGGIMTHGGSPRPHSLHTRPHVLQSLLSDLGGGSLEHMVAPHTAREVKEAMVCDARLTVSRTLFRVLASLMCHDASACEVQPSHIAALSPTSPARLLFERQLVQEVAALLTLNHPHVVRVSSMARRLELPQLSP
jgi:hypothetical protein